MQPINIQIKIAAAAALNYLFPDHSFEEKDILINETKPEFVGDYTIVLFPFLKILKQKPADLGKTLGTYLISQQPIFKEFEVVAGFLNLTLSDSYWIKILNEVKEQKGFGEIANTNKKIMVEYSSPNTNKPLHFGHLRNNFLGWSVSEILKQTGNEVIKANLVNDRGIHICKSMVAWKRYANGEKPKTNGLKGDHLVGNYYVKFNDVYKAEVQQLIAEGTELAIAEKEAPIMKEAQALLVKWEQGDKEVYELWETMNGWVYQGFDITYNQLGIDFDKVYHESETYLLGKEIVQKGLENGILYKKENGSVWIDLTNEGLDEKLLLRADGTSVYMTQDLGTAILKYQEYKVDQSIYVIGDEQNYHMQVLKLILEKLGEPCASGLFHLSYGMVELPTGRMKSREGTVVDADDMIEEMVQLAKEQTEQAGKTDGFTQKELEELYKMIGLGALKFYLLRVEPKKKMIFDPKESIDLHGFTATFIQYAHARICSIIRKVELEVTAVPESQEALFPLEKALALQIEQFQTMMELAARELNPAVICNYAFRLAQTFNSFFDKHSVIHAENNEKKRLRLLMAENTAKTLKKSMALLGISVPQRM